MVSWSQAFGTAIRIVLYSIIWWIIGVILIAIGLTGWGNYYYSNPSFSFVSPVTGFIFVIIFILTGSILIIFGTTASFLKFQSELVTKEVFSRLVQYQTRTIDNQSMNTKYCTECENQTPNESSFCIHCGKKL